MRTEDPQKVNTHNAANTSRKQRPAVFTRKRKLIIATALLLTGIGIIYTIIYTWEKTYLFDLNTGKIKYRLTWVYIPVWTTVEESEYTQLLRTEKIIDIDRFSPQWVVDSSYNNQYQRQSPHYRHHGIIFDTSRFCRWLKWHKFEGKIKKDIIRAEMRRIRNYRRFSSLSLDLLLERYLKLQTPEIQSSQPLAEQLTQDDIRRQFHTFVTGLYWSSDSPPVNYVADHVILTVPNIQKATRLYNKAGFTVVSGGSFSNPPVQNAMVPFADGTCIELLSPSVSDMTYHSSDHSPTSTIINRLTRPGFVNVVIAPRKTPLSSEIKRLHDLGIIYSQPTTITCSTSQSQEIKYSISEPLMANTTDFPLLIEDETPRQDRIPVVNEHFHPNGIVGMERYEFQPDFISNSIDVWNSFVSGVRNRKDDGEKIFLQLGPIHVVLHRDDSFLRPESRRLLLRRRNAEYVFLDELLSNVTKDKP